MNFVGCAAFLAHNTRSTLEADILKAHEETKMASRHLSVHLSPLLLPSLSFSPGRRETAMDTSLPDNGWSFKTREPIFAFVSRDSPLSHSTSPRSTRQRGWQSGTKRRCGFSLGARIKSYELLHGQNGTKFGDLLFSPSTPPSRFTWYYVIFNDIYIYIIECVIHQFVSTLKKKYA